MDTTQITIQDAARAYARSVRMFQAGQLTADQHRQSNRALKAMLSEDQWERVKATAIGAMQGRDGK